MRKLALVILAAVSVLSLGGCSCLGELGNFPLGLSVGRPVSTGAAVTVMPATYAIPVATPYPVAAVQPMPTVMPYSAYAAPMRPQLSK